MMMVTLVVATTTDPASINPAKELLSMPGWAPAQNLLIGIKSYANEGVRLLEISKGIVEEDDLDLRWEAATSEIVNDVIFLSKHTAVSNKPALTVHPIGVPHLREGDVAPQGGRPGWAALPHPRMGPWIRLLHHIAKASNLIPEFEITMEATHHGPITSKPTMFLEIGSTEEYWRRQDAAKAIAQLVWKGLGIGGSVSVGDWSSGDEKKVLLGIGGGHYVPRHMDIIKKDEVWVGHLLSGYSIPMEDPKQSKEGSDTKFIGGTWKHSINAALEATRSAFPGGQTIAHLDHKSFKGWQKTAITEYLMELGVRIGKPNDFP